MVGKRIWKLKQTDEELLYHVCGRKSNLSVPDYCKTKLPASLDQKKKGNYIITPDRRQSKTLILSTNIVQKLSETEFLIAICSLTGNKWQSKTLFLAILDPHSSIVKSVLDCCLHGVIIWIGAFHTIVI